MGNAKGSKHKVGIFLDEAEYKNKLKHHAWTKAEKAENEKLDIHAALIAAKHGRATQKQIDRALQVTSQWVKKIA